MCWLLELYYLTYLLYRLIGSLDSLQQTGGAVDADPAGGQSGRPSSSPGQPTTTGMSDKLRESLLRVSREHYASIKKVIQMHIYFYEWSLY